MRLRVFQRSVLVCLALWTAAVAPATSQGSPPAGPGSELSVYLLTMGQGDLVWEKFGHNAIWIHDPAHGTDRVYNYGLFDFNSPGYWTRFLQGNWIYELGVSDIENTLYQYRYFNRSVVAQELNLTTAEKAELQEFLEWNARPGNREYNYDYYRDNCSTRVRDVLDRVLGGRIRAATAGVPAGTTYRWQSERLIADAELSYTGLLVGLGPAADMPLSVWQEMFIPMLLQEHLREITVTDPAGRIVPLVRSERVLVAADREPERAAPPNWWPFYLLAGLLFGGALVLSAHFAPTSVAARWGFAALGGLWSLIAGTAGLLLLGLLFTDHSIAHRNENLFQMTPLALPLAVLIPALVFGVRWAARPAWWLALAAVAFSLLGWALQILPVLDQVNGSVIAVALPINLGLTLGVYRLRNALGQHPPRGADSPRTAPRRAALR